jgi:hypothetical protein
MGVDQPRSRRLAPAHLIGGISSERQSVSRDLAVRRVVLPGWGVDDHLAPSISTQQ